VLPRSLQALSITLEISSKEILRDLSPQEERVALRVKRLEYLLSKDPTIDRDTAWHTLILLERDPIERLGTALKRGRK